MKINFKHYFLIPFLFIFPVSTSAQLIPDQSLGNESSIVNSVNNFKQEINGGAVRGSTLFHSFQKFNVNSGQSVYFTPRSNINNIFTRVTGTNVSNILGTLGVEGNANLFLINPNGIIFGENAKLDLNGSFFGTTANSIVFDNGFEFSSKNTQRNPIFRQNFPDGLGFGLNLDAGSGDIVVKGKGHNLKQTFPNIFSEGRNPALGFQVQPKSSINFIANNIAFESGMATAEGGKIELISVKKGLVTFNPSSPSNWMIDYQKVNEFADIQLSNRSILDVSSPENELNSLSAGFIKLIGKNITITDQSIALLQNRNPQISGNIIVEASNSLILKDNNRPNEQGSIFVGGALRSESIENGPGGKISINAPIVFLDNSRISSITYGNVAGGNIEIATDKLDVINRSNITSDTIGTGMGGNISINVSNNVKVTDSFSGIRSNTLGFGNAGDIDLEAKSVSIENGAKIGSAVVSTREARFIDPISELNGSGGNIIIKTENLEIIGKSPAILNNIAIDPVAITRISALESSSYGDTKAGDIKVHASKLFLSNGSQIRGSAFANGNAGNIDIYASDIFLNAAEISLSTEAATSQEFRSALNLPNSPTGNAGTLRLNVDRLYLDNNSRISTISTLRFGGSILISGLQPSTPSSLVSLNNKSIIETNNSTISNSSIGTIDIYTGDLVLNNGSKILANVSDSTETPLEPNLNLVGGNVNIKTTGDIKVLNNSSISAEVNNLPGGAIDGGNINIQTEGNILLANNISPRAAISASVNEFGNGGSIKITLPNGILVAVSNADIRATAINGNGGDIIIEAFSILTTPDVDITASSQRGLDGNIEINTVTTPEKFVIFQQAELPAYNQEILTTCRPGSQKSETQGFESLSQAEKNESFGRFKLNLFVSLSSQSIDGKTIDEIKLLEPNAAITIDGDTYFGKACLTKIIS